MIRKAIIMGAAGRDFHNFNTFFRENPQYKVVAFTAAQISELDTTAGVEKRVYPAELAGSMYPEGIRIYPEAMLEELIKKHDADEVFFSYSDVSAKYLHDEAARVQAAGATFVLLGPKDTMIQPKKPLISICASRTGSGKSPTSRWLVRTLKQLGYRVVVIRHPMPYGDLIKQRVQRFESYEDLDKHDCTVEEREDYEPHIDNGAIVYSGVDYQDIIDAAEKEADIVVWDGGNNDFPFYVPSKHIVIVDPHRVGHELSYYPGETNVRMADIVIVGKVNTAKPEDVKQVKENVRRINPNAKIIDANIVISAEDEDKLTGKRVLVIEDGPTLTHGEMKYGAATIKAKEKNAVIVDPRPYAKGTIKEVYDLWPHLGELLPAVGYSEHQMKELEDSINAVPCDIVLMGTPTDLRRYLKVDKPVLRVTYDYKEIEPGQLVAELEGVLP
ncbi:MAG: cyclic 2,3-diphosphoglycerate synthase [Candidatus Bathyarchaeota archaeon]|nr:cyclic 2,3-diphosphoglycerate synthase [Candidatus Bathyarchaeota archaeon]